MKRKLVVFVTDAGFLVPSIVAAKQIYDQNITDIADIQILTLDLPVELVTKLNEEWKGRISFSQMNFDFNFGGKDIRFFANHVPLASLARLTLHEFIDPQYEHIVYIDGDVQVVGSIRPLLDLDVPEGKIGAGRGSAWLDRWAKWKLTPPGYLAGLGGVSEDDYFNAGVLAFSRDTWAKKGREALDFFINNSAACIRHDQSALNSVFRDNVLHFPPRYNFHSVYSDFLNVADYSPAIIHFTGPNKPWNYNGLPWRSRFMASYLDLLAQYPYLKPYLKTDTTRGGSLKERLAQRIDSLKQFRSKRALRRAFFEHLKTADYSLS